MKHLKLFEYYSRDEFGVYTDKVKIEELWNDLEHRQKFTGIFTPEEESILGIILTPVNGRMYANQGSVHISFSDAIIVGRSFGDYCYGVFVEDLNQDVDNMWQECEICDQFDNFLISLKRIIAKYGPVNESFDRYSFGEHSGEVSNQDKMEYVRKNSIPFTKDEIQQIDAVLSNCKNIDYDADDHAIQVTFEITGDTRYEQDYFDFFSMGDYCYAVARYEMESDYEQEIDTYHYSRVWIFDEIEELLDLARQINELQE